MSHYIFLILILTVGRYVDMPLWQIVGIAVAGAWELRQLEGGEWR